MSNQIDRRTLAKGAAWAAPVLTVAAAAPMVAASTSPTPTPTPTVSGFAEKCPGKSDVPGGWPKHGYRVVLTVRPEPSVVMPVDVRLGNGKYAKVITDATRIGEGWEFVVDAKSSPSKMTVTANVDGSLVTVAIKAHPHCIGRP